MSIIPSFHEALRQTHFERIGQLTAAVVFIYEYVITFGYEVDYFWTKRWSLGKGLFLWSRYYGMGISISNAVVYMLPRPSLDLCLKFFHWQNTGTILQILTTHFILELRLYAMYGSSKKLLAFFCFLTCAEIAAAVYLFETPYEGLIGTNEPVPGVHICADGDPAHKHFMVYYPLSSLLTEVVLLSLAVYKAYLNYLAVHGGIIELLFKDSVRYFVCIFTIYLATTIMWFVNDLTLNESLTGYFMSLSIVFANRLMINIREIYYKDEAVTMYTFSDPKTSETSMPVWQVPSSPSMPSRNRRSKSAIQMENIELRTFSERQGF